MSRRSALLSTRGSTARDLGFLGWLALGVGIGVAGFTLLEPRQGAARRALLRDKTASGLRRLGREMRGRLVDARSRVRGAIQESRARLTGPEVGDEPPIGAARAGREVEDRLDVHDEPGSVSSLQGGDGRPR